MKKIDISKLIYQFALVACILLTSLSHRIGHADILDDTDTVLNWAESFYPQIFPSHQATQRTEPWLYRYYPETNIYVGTNTNDNSIYFLGGDWEDRSPRYINNLSYLLKVAKSGGANSASELFSITLPGFPHQIDFYNPVGATKALVFLHGAIGRNYIVAFDLGINLAINPPAMDTVNWTWLENEKVLAVFPQGQAISGIVTTWSNNVMDSGQDDVAFLQTLAAYIKHQFNTNEIYLGGFSMGGVMTNRMWCESPETFNGYIAVAGPPSAYYLSNPCKPSIFQPYLGIIGGLDPVLQTEGNWNEPIWSISPILTNGPGFINPDIINEWESYQYRVQLACGEFPIDSDKISNGATEIWRNCGERYELQYALFGSHSIKSLEQETGSKIIDQTINFTSKK